MLSDIGQAKTYLQKGLPETHGNPFWFTPDEQLSKLCISMQLPSN